MGIPKIPPIVSYREGLEKKVNGYESIALLGFLGYLPVPYRAIPSPKCKYLIDDRSPMWRGWRSAMADIVWQHHDQMVEWNRRKALDKQTVCAYNGATEDDDASCFT